MFPGCGFLDLLYIRAKTASDRATSIGATVSLRRAERARCIGGAVENSRSVSPDHTVTGSGGDGFGDLRREIISRIRPRS
jgi:hypothetical protein